MAHQRRHPNLIILNQIQVDTILRSHESLSALRLTAIKTREKFANLLFVRDHFLDFVVGTSKLKLVAKLRYPILDERFSGNVLIEHPKIRCTDGEDMADEIWIVLGDAINHCTTPIVAANDNFVDA